MAKKLETIKLIASLEKAGRTTKHALWKDVAKRLDAPSRNAGSVSITHINTLAKHYKGKTFLVVGKVLSQGELTQKVDVVAVSASAMAQKKIMASGTYTTLLAYANSAAKVDVKKVMIVQ